jgi:hypothetical protein
MSQVSRQDVADAASVGRAGVQALVVGARDVMVALCPLREGIESATTLVPLATAIESERAIPSKWLHARPIPVTQPFLNYLRPLIENDPIAANGCIAKLVKRGTANDRTSGRSIGRADRRIRSRAGYPGSR